MWGRKNQQTSDIEALAKHASAGDVAAFEQLVRITYADAYTLAMRITNNTEDAADATQDAYIKMQRSISKFRGDAAFTTWMYRVVANCSATQLARRKKHRHDDLDAETSIGSGNASVERDSQLPISKEELFAAIAQLPDTLRTVIVLRDLYDMAHRDIAKELDITESTAKVRLHRARNLLRSNLETTTSLGAFRPSRKAR